MKSDIDIKEVSGELCKRKRPHNSSAEDVVISVLANNIAQKQMAYVNVNVYVKDDDIDGQNEEQSQRLRLLCQLSMQSVEAIHGKDYKVSFDDTDGQRVIESEGEHIINNKLLYQIINEEV